MTLKKDTLKKLKDLGFKTDDLIAAIKSEDETDFTMPEINHLTEEQLTERDKNTIAAAKPGILKEGKDTGIEIANKAIAKKYGLTDVDTKDPDKVIAALDAKVATGDTGLKEQISLLQKDKLTLEAAVEAEKGNVTKIKQDTDLLTSLPSNRLSTMSDKDYLALVKLNLEFETVDGIPVVKRDGAILRDKTTQAPIAPKDAINSLFAEKKWSEEGAKGGRGGNDNSGGGSSGIKTMSKFQEQFTKDNPNKPLMSPEFQTALQLHTKEMADFDWEK